MVLDHTRVRAELYDTMERLGVVGGGRVPHIASIAMWVSRMLAYEIGRCPIHTGSFFAGMGGLEEALGIHFGE
jgi:hypothetical protein